MLLMKLVYPTSINLPLLFLRAKLRIIKYRDYKHFDNNELRNEFIKELSFNKVQSDHLTQFTNISGMILEKRNL